MDWQHLDQKRQPGFFRFYTYKGETFEKYGEFSPGSTTNFNAAFEITLLNVLSPVANQNVLSWALHSSTGEKAPYLLRNGNHWFMGDSPFVFLNESDRYLIFADLLFDLVNEQPRYTGKRPALVRFEDIHAQLPDSQLYGMLDVFKRQQVPFGVSLIPIFSDPLGAIFQDPAQRYVKMTDRPKFIEYLKTAVANRGSIIWHGVTHQYGQIKNPFNGVSGDDFEFWDRQRNGPIREDSPEYVVGRLQEGADLIQQAGLKATSWLTPHYEASPLDYKIFGQLFLWNVGRVIYFPFQSSQSLTLPMNLTFDFSGTESNALRLPFFADLKVSYAQELQPAGQIFPYEIYGDVFGQRLIPEDVGNVQPFLSEQVVKTVTVDDMVRIMRRNRVIRDAWGSFFIHGVLLSLRGDGGLADFPGDTRELERLFSSAKDMGYEFVDLSAWTRNNPSLKRPEPVEVDR